MITNSLNLNINVQFQKIVWLALPLFFILIIFFIGSVAETNRVKKPYASFNCSSKVAKFRVNPKSSEY